MTIVCTVLTLPLDCRRGWPHEAAVNGTTDALGGARRGSNGPSLHVTFGVESALSGTYESLVHHALEVASVEYPYLFGPREAEVKNIAHAAAPKGHVHQHFCSSHFCIVMSLLFMRRRYFAKTTRAQPGGVRLYARSPATLPLTLVLSYCSDHSFFATFAQPVAPIAVGGALIDEYGI